MQHVGVLIDFSELSPIAVEFAVDIAKRTHSKVSLVHAYHEGGGNHAGEVISKMAPYLNTIKEAGLEAYTQIAPGNYEVVIPEILSKTDIEMVVVGTHGIHGVKQYLFGANILHLVKKLHIPALVVQMNSPIPGNESADILFPMSPHENFIDEVVQTIILAKIFNARILVYTIIKTDEGPGERIESNKALACSEFAKHGVDFIVIDEPATTYSYGYGKQILQYASNHKVSFISMMSQVSSGLAIMGNADKERMILNEDAIPVFCVNSGNE